MPRPRARHTPSAPRAASPPSRRMAAAVRSTSSPSSSPWISVSPTASAPSISERWEIDLSPGARAVPESAAALRGTTGWGAGDKLDAVTAFEPSIGIAAAFSTGAAGCANPAKNCRDRGWQGRLTVRAEHGNGATTSRTTGRPDQHPGAGPRSERREQTGMGHQANLPELWRALLRHAQGHHRLPEMRGDL